MPWVTEPRKSLTVFAAELEIPAIRSVQRIVLICRCEVEDTVAALSQQPGHAVRCEVNQYDVSRAFQSRPPSGSAKSLVLAFGGLPANESTAR